MEHNFRPDIAKRYGIKAAIILHNFYFWTVKNKANNKNFYDGYYWTYNSISALSKIFWYMSKDQIRRVLKKLEADGVIKVGNYNANPYDQTKWYAIVDDFVLNAYKSIDNTSIDIAADNTTVYKPHHLAKSPNRYDKIAKCIYTDNKPDNKQYNKDNKSEIYIDNDITNSDKVENFNKIKRIERKDNVLPLNNRKEKKDKDIYNDDRRNVTKVTKHDTTPAKSKKPRSERRVLLSQSELFDDLEQYREVKRAFINAGYKKQIGRDLFYKLDFGYYLKKAAEWSANKNVVMNTAGWVNTLWNSFILPDIEAGRMVLKSDKSIPNTTDTKKVAKNSVLDVPDDNYTPPIDNEVKSKSNNNQMITTLLNSFKYLPKERTKEMFLNFYHTYPELKNELIKRYSDMFGNEWKKWIE